MTAGFQQRMDAAIDASKSFLCVGLDLDPARMPERFRAFPRGYLAFARRIIEATSDYAAAYKPNLAFYECHGTRGWRILELIREAIPTRCLAIADAKRGDIGNTSRMYAKAMFDTMGFDAMTLAPYMGRDSLEPFFEYANKGCFVLCATTNAGADDFQVPGALYLEVARRCVEWNANGNVGLVVGATRTDCMTEVRQRAPRMPFLVPGIGAQGGDLAAVLAAGRDDAGRGMLINASRSILYASTGDDFAEAARDEARRLTEAIDVQRT